GAIAHSASVAQRLHRPAVVQKGAVGPHGAVAPLPKSPSHATPPSAPTVDAGGGCGAKHTWPPSMLAPPAPPSTPPAPVPPQLARAAKRATPSTLPVRMGEE